MSYEKLVEMMIEDDMILAKRESTLENAGLAGPRNGWTH